MMEKNRRTFLKSAVGSSIGLGTISAFSGQVEAARTTLEVGLHKPDMSNPTTVDYTIKVNTTDCRKEGKADSNDHLSKDYNQGETTIHGTLQPGYWDSFSHNGLINKASFIPRSNTLEVLKIKQSGYISQNPEGAMDVTSYSSDFISTCEFWTSLWVAAGGDGTIEDGVEHGNTRDAAHDNYGRSRTVDGGHDHFDITGQFTKINMTSPLGNSPLTFTVDWGERW
ncbi:hypothetical protein [Haladaptatus sp. R4]|uniref:hypothetical protein n=1 Tax=Haladaptatus sp. R4 TaxID=1679489 RepID=UPI000AC45555|nr:hypothetical protein [Haladaptatus sp. R4]